ITARDASPSATAPTPADARAVPSAAISCHTPVEPSGSGARFASAKPAALWTWSSKHGSPPTHAGEPGHSARSRSVPAAWFEQVGVAHARRVCRVQDLRAQDLAGRGRAVVAADEPEEAADAYGLRQRPLRGHGRPGAARRVPLGDADRDGEPGAEIAEEAERR